MAHDLYTYSLDEEAATILKEIPKTKKSQFVSEAVKLKARMLEQPVIEAPKTFRVKLHG